MDGVAARSPEAPGLPAISLRFRSVRMIWRPVSRLNSAITGSIPDQFACVAAYPSNVS